MDSKDRLILFEKLGQKISNLSQEEKDLLYSKAKNQNNWFTYDSCESAFRGISKILANASLSDFLDNYTIQDFNPPKEIGLMLAGNIPAVGFHDILCVLLSGNKACIKLSSTDSVLIQWILDTLIQLDSRISSLISLEEMLKGKDAYIATGSDNSSRYFNYYFGKYPHVIRRNRTSVAVMSGDETSEELKELGKDIFLYFGLGCRNVSKVFVKNESEVGRLLDEIAPFFTIADHHKYFNNYEYNKSIYLVNRDQHLDNGFLLLRESKELVSPIGVLFYEIYENQDQLETRLAEDRDKIQCIVSRCKAIKNSIPFGKAQFPEVNDFADGVDTMSFLTQLK